MSRSVSSRAACPRSKAGPCRNAVEVGATLQHRSIVDSAFKARVIEAGPPVGTHPTVITEVEGAAYRTGQHTFTLDDRDSLGRGFLLR